jgi:hypothetical protein
VERSTESESFVEQAAGAVASHGGAELTQVTDAIGASVDEHGTFGAARYGGDPAAASFARDHRLVTIALGSGGTGAVRFAFERQRDISRQRVLAQQPANVDIVTCSRQTDVESRLQSPRTRD